MLPNKTVWRCGNKVLFSILISLSATYSFGMEEDSPGAGGPSWSGKIEVNQEEYWRHVLEQAAVSSRVQEEERADDPLPDWLVQSCIQNMPPLLKGIYNYMKSGAMDDSKRVVPAFHRFLLVGPSGSSKSTTAEAIAQSLGYEKKIISASSLLGRYRSHTALNICDLFKKHRSGKSKKILIINELHKLFEGHTNQHTDHAETAMSFWEQLDMLERYYHNIITAVTSNQADKIPKELKSRFRGQWIYMPLLGTDQAVDVFDHIVAQDTSIKVNEVVRKDALAFFCLGDKKYSHRDVKLFIDTAKMFAYAEQMRMGCIVLTSDHFKQARYNFDDPERIMKFEEEQMDEQERRHQDTLRLQEQHFVQQQEIQIALNSHQETAYKYHERVCHFPPPDGSPPVLKETMQTVSEKGQRIARGYLSTRQRSLLREIRGENQKQEREEQEVQERLEQEKREKEKTGAVEREAVAKKAHEAAAKKAEEVKKQDNGGCIVM